MEFQFKIEPSNEGLLLGTGLVIGAFAITVVGRKIYDWIQEKKEGKRTPIDKMRGYVANIKLPIDLSKFDIPQSSDPQYSSVRGSGAHHGVEFSTLLNAATSLNAALPKFASTTGDVKPLTGVLNQIQSTIPVSREKDGSILVEFADHGLVWPSDPFYKDLKGCTAKFEQVMTSVKAHCIKILGACEKILSSPADGLDESALKGRAAYIQMCEAMLLLASGTYAGYINNLHTIEEETEIQE
jgi:hypothetical protein